MVEGSGTLTQPTRPFSIETMHTSLRISSDTCGTVRQSREHEYEFVFVLCSASEWTLRKLARGQLQGKSTRLEIVILCRQH